MPPRRSTRASLPTPADSTKAESVISTPGNKSSESFTALDNGMITPASLDDETEEEDLLLLKDAKSRGTKRKANPVDSAPASPPSPAPQTKFVMDSVVIPTRSSKLSSEKTTSADNLTLGSGTSKPSTGRKTKAVDSAQPFNIGKYSTVKKETMSSLALETAAADNIATSSPANKGKGKAKAKTRASKARKEPSPLKSFSDESSVSEADDDRNDKDFAMDTDEEEDQLQDALQASRGGAADTDESDADLPLSKAKGSKKAGKTAPGLAKKPVFRKASGRGDNRVALRAAVARAAEQRANGGGAPAEASSTIGTSTGQATPHEPTGLSREDSPLSGLSSDGSDYESDDSEAVVAKPKPARRGRVSRGKGQRLDGAAVDDNGEPWMMDPLMDTEALQDYERIKEEKRAARRAREEEVAPFKKKERVMKKELGRKLTNGEKNLIRLEHHHPELQNVWGDLAVKVEPVKPVPMEAHPSLKLTLLPFQKESLYWMKKQEEGTWKGGMLADEMGMGKTIQTIALLLSEPRRKPSLVVAPVVALMQWKHEIETHAEGFTVCLWHGQQRMKASELKKYDVVLSSYGTLEAAFRRQQNGFKKGNTYIKQKSPMHEFEWFRVILDEAHNIKERSTNAAKAAFALNATYKWCLSGTPLQNRVGELYSLVRFLGADPFSHYFCKRCDCKALHWKFSDKRHCDQCGHSPMEHVCFWNTEILTPIAKYGIETGNPGHTAFKKLKILLDRMMLRRTKLERADDLGLPPRVITVRRDYFSPAEKELYSSLFTGAKRQFATYIDQGTVLNNYSNIFSLITRMRQMACHPDLVLKSKTAMANVEMPEGTVCRLCNDQAEDAIASQCKHVFDRECIRQYLEVQNTRGRRPECPVCHIEISIDLEAEAIDLDDGGAKKARQGILSRLNLESWRSSTKLEALVEELEKLRNQDSTIKSLVFSQFVSFLDLIAFRLQRAGFNICRLEGGMTPQQRDATIQHFMKEPGVTVFLISLKAGGVALNLTEASMVFMMDSWWNPSVEYQAMDRIHRLGQKRPVKVVKLVVEDSIEDQIVQLQAKKLAMTEAALNTDPDAALGKLTVEDLGFLFKM